MKSKQISQAPQTMFNTSFHAPVGIAYINSVNSSDIHIEITQAELWQIDTISTGQPELEKAAQEIHTALPQRASVLEKVQKWVALLASVEGLTEKAIQHGPKIAAIIHNFTPK